MIRNALVFLGSCFLAVFAILGTRMTWYRWTIEERIFPFGIGGFDGPYLVAWVPTFAVSFFVGILLAWALQASNPVLWTAALGVVIGVARFSQASHTFYGQPSLGSLVGVYGVYFIPVVGAVLGAYAARWMANRMLSSANG